MRFINLGLIILSYYGAASEVLDNPTVHYCFYSEERLLSSRGCTLSQISNSTFEFGKRNQNVLAIPSWFTLPYLLLKCSAPYPIRWLAAKPLRNISELSNPDTNRFSQNPLSTTTFEYSQEITFDLEKKFSRILRCEGFNDAPRAADVFINTVIENRPRFSIDTESGTYFVAAENGGALPQAIVPCLANEFNGDFEVTIARSKLRDRKEENLTLIRTDPSDYDPRIGMRINRPIDFNSYYVCVSDSQSATKSTRNRVIPLNPERERKAQLSYDDASGHIKCTMKGIGSQSYASPDLFVGKCKSLTECEFKFKPMFPDAFPPRGTSLQGHFELSKPTSTGSETRNVTSYNQGYLHCFAVYGLSGTFLSKSGYFFTGLDNKKHIYSEPHPENSIISIQSPNAEHLISGKTYNFPCKISTFVLLPNIQFVVGYSNDQPQLVKFGEPSNLARILEFNIDDGNATLTWSLELIVNVRMIKVTCYSPRITSEDWARAELMLKVSESVASTQATTKESTGTSFLTDKPVVVEPLPEEKHNGGDHLNVYAIAGISVSVAIFLIMFVLVCVVLKTLSASVAIMQKLTKEEVNEFYNGTTNGEKNSDGVVPIESLAFNDNMKISSSQLSIGNVVLGEGQFGIVRKGLLSNQVVAVKSTKPSADIDYFKAFLKELKVMAYIGEHPNIVRFVGAVVEDIDKGTCFAVLELSPFGNLTGYLRQHSKDYEDAGSNRPQPKPRNEFQLQIILNQPTLIFFCKQIAKGMKYLARKKVIHGDLATRNILVFEGNILKITDFGLSRKLYTCNNYTKKNQAPLPWPWMALESLRFMEFSTKSDVWSYGVTAWEIFSLGQVPFSGQAWTPEFADQIEAGLRLSKPAHAHQVAYNWMMSCWNNDPESRPTFLECQRFFASLGSEPNHGDN